MLSGLFYNISIVQFVIVTHSICFVLVVAGRAAQKKLIPGPIWLRFRHVTCGFELRCSRNVSSKLSSIWSHNQTSKYKSREKKYYYASTTFVFFSDTTQKILWWQIQITVPFSVIFQSGLLLQNLPRSKLTDKCGEQS